MKLFTWANMLTLSNLFSGSLAILVLLEYRNIIPNSHEWVGALLLVSLICDFLDGFVARKTGTAGPLGIELDSLADVVTFGLLPALLMYHYLLAAIRYESNFSPFSEPTFSQLISPIYFVAFSGIFIVLFSALRLAKFNVEDSSSAYFKGLNTPTNAIFIYGLHYYSIDNIYVLLGIIAMVCYLLVSDIPMFSLKFKNFNPKKDAYIIVFGIITVLALIFLKERALAPLVMLYILFSLLFKNKFDNQ